MFKAKVIRCSKSVQLFTYVVCMLYTNLDTTNNYFNNAIATHSPSNNNNNFIFRFL